MREKIAFLVPFQEMVDTIQQVIAHRNVDVLIFLGIDQYPSVAELSKMGVEAIITRGSPVTSEYRQQTTIPIINCNPTGMDLCKAFSEAKRHDSKIGFVNAWFDDFDKTVFEDILEISIQVATCCTDNETIGWAISSFAEAGIKVVVGGQFVLKKATELGIQCVKLYTARATIVEAIEKAKEIIRISRAKKVEAEQLRIILDSEQNGILSLNEDKVVTVFNRSAEKITGIKKEEIIGNTIENFPQLKPILGDIDSNSRQSEEVIKFAQNTIISTRVPIVMNGIVAGGVITVQQIDEIQEKEVKIRRYLSKKGLMAKYGFDMLAGESTEFKDTVSEAKGYSATDSTILIEGETGTGKSLLAQAIHLASRRAKGPFVAVNCSALPESLLESELFGYEEGAFTGASRRGKPGLFELAHKGTIFLDEIAGTTLHMQSRLLRVVEEKEIMRVGGDEVIPLDVRIIAASNLNLLSACLENDFRFDLYYRLNVLNLKLPSLRERKDDIIFLFRYFLHIFKIDPKQIDAVMDVKFCNKLCDYDWPGNVRELEHIAEKTAALLKNIPGSDIENVHRIIINGIQGHQDLYKKCINKDGLLISIGTMEEMENEIIYKLYTKYCGNKTQLSKQLNLSRTTLGKKLNNVLVKDLG